MKLTYENVGKILVEFVPDLSAAYESSFYEGKPLIHVFFGKVASYIKKETTAIMKEHESLVSQKREYIQTILNVMEEALTSGSENLKEAVMASFLEDLDTDDEKLFHYMLHMMGPLQQKTIRDLIKFYHSEKWISFLRRTHRKR